MNKLQNKNLQDINKKKNKTKHKRSLQIGSPSISPAWNKDKKWVNTVNMVNGVHTYQQKNVQGYQKQQLYNETRLILSLDHLGAATY